MRRSEIGSPFVASLAERPYHSLGVLVGDGQEYAGRLVGNAASSLSLLKISHIETEAVCEFPPTQPEPLAEGGDPAGRRIIDDSTGQLRVATDVVENLAKRRFDVPSEFGAFHAHCPIVFFCNDFSILITQRPDRPSHSRVRRYFHRRQEAVCHSAPATGQHAYERAESP